MRSQKKPLSCEQIIKHYVAHWQDLIVGNIDVESHLDNNGKYIFKPYEGGVFTEEQWHYIQQKVYNIVRKKLRKPFCK